MMRKSNDTHGFSTFALVDWQMQNGPGPGAQTPGESPDLTTAPSGISRRGGLA